MRNLRNQWPESKQTERKLEDNLIDQNSGSLNLFNINLGEKPSIFDDKRISKLKVFHLEPEKIKEFNDR